MVSKVGQSLEKSQADDGASEILQMIKIVHDLVRDNFKNNGS